MGGQQTWEVLSSVEFFILHSTKDGEGVGGAKVNVLKFLLGALNKIAS